MAHAEIDAAIDRLVEDRASDELTLRRLKKQRLVLRDRLARIEVANEPREPA